MNNFPHATHKSCPYTQHNSSGNQPRRRHQCRVRPALLQFNRCYPHTTTMSSPVQLTSFNNFTAAHDLMSCPTEYSTALSSTQQSVRILKPTPATVHICPKNTLFAEFYSNAIQKITLIPENERKTQDNAQKLKWTLFYCFFSQKTIEQCQNQLKNSLKPWENDSTAQNNEESTEIAEFYLENKKKSKKTQCSSSENPVAKVHFEMSFPWKLEGT